VELRQRLLLNAFRTLALSGVAASTLAASPPTSPSLPALSRLASEGALVSAVVWDLQADRPVAELNGRQRLTPASLSKLVIAAAALDVWPPDKNFPTEIRSLAAPVGGTVSGDLILRGSGDATLDETTLWALAAQLRGNGILRVSGGIRVERAPFGELDCDTIDRCAGLRRSSRAYNAAPSAIGVNYGSWCIAVRAPVNTTTASVGGCATGEMPIPLSGNVTVSAIGAPLRIERTTENGGDRIVAGGSIAPGTERQVHRAMSDPAAGAGLILRSILRQTGVNVVGNVETTAQTIAGAGHLLAKVDGLPLQEQVGRMMRYSNNYIADVLTMGVALETNHVPPRSLAEASKVLTDFLRKSGMSIGAATEVPVMESGSGLTTSNRLSAQDLVSLLRRQFRDSRHFPAFYGSLVVPRDASFDYMQRGNADWLDRVALKTGSLTEPVSVNGVAGYLRQRDGGFMAFAIIVNGSQRLRQVSHDRALAASRSDIEALLALR
jgi:D-alanyl-D-alanine carboxypeptidase/D-alanyl-D-alanine-endopeptidase (penicillin-binding protein 4)